MNNFVADQGSTGNTIIDFPSAKQEGLLVLPFPAHVVDKGPNITVFPEHTSEGPTILDTPATVKEEPYVETFPAAESKSVEDMILWSENTSDWLTGKDGKVNWKSRPNFGHTFETHGQGAKNTSKLIDRAKTTGQQQGQWLDNQKVAEYLNRLGKINECPVEITIPEGLGQVGKPDGTTVPSTKALVIINMKTGKIRTAYPIID